MDEMRIEYSDENQNMIHSYDGHWVGVPLDEAWIEDDCLLFQFPGHGEFEKEAIDRIYFIKREDLVVISPCHTDTWDEGFWFKSVKCEKGRVITWKKHCCKTIINWAGDKYFLDKDIWYSSLPPEHYDKSDDEND